MTSEPSISVEDITVERGGHAALTGITFDLGPGTLMGILGPNGAGKSTLFDAIAGLLPVAHGTLRLTGTESSGALAYVQTEQSARSLSDFPAATSYRLPFRLKTKPDSSSAITTRRWLSTQGPIPRHISMNPYILRSEHDHEPH